jgi:hypothetical protein
MSLFDTHDLAEITHPDLLYFSGVQDQKRPISRGGNRP